MKALPIFFLLFIFQTHVCSQASFHHYSNLHSGQKLTSTLPICITDLNNDLMDDVAILDKGNHLYILYQGLQNEPYKIEDLGQVSVDLQWSIVAVDLDRNGYRDIVVAGVYDGVKIYYQDENGWNKQTIDMPELWSQAMNAVDVNLDGWTDLFICNDQGYNVLFLNDQGVLKEDQSVFRELPKDSSAGNYGSIWSDFDQDGDPDLFIAKCYAFADTKGDARRKNRLYRNDRGSFTEVAESLDLNHGDQSWTGDFVDFDNDGDFDVFITNHDSKAIIMKNQNGGFENVTDASGLNVIGSVMQGIQKDFDADGLIDILIAGSRHEYHNNTDDLRFIRNANPFEQYYFVNSCAGGDLNFDGHLDVYATYPNLITGPSTLSDKFWIAEKNDNGVIEVYLTGRTSNPDGIGCILKLYGPWGIQTKEVRAGESYSIMHSLTSRFGIGTFSKADSLVIKWPSGLSEFIEDIPANSYVFQVENEISIKQVGTLSKIIEICKDEEVVIIAPPGFKYKWSSGQTSQNIMVNETGFYQVVIEDSTGRKYTLPGHQVIVDPALQPQITIFNGAVDNCEGDLVTLYCGINAPLEWVDGSTDSLLDISTSGTYYCKAKGLCNDFTSDTIEVKFMKEGVVDSISHDSIKKGEQATLFANGKNVIWYQTETSDSIVGIGKTIFIQDVQKDTSLWASNKTIQEYSLRNIGPSTDSLEFTDVNSNRFLSFEILSDVFIESITVFADSVGKRRVFIEDPRRREVFSIEMEFQKGENVIPIHSKIAWSYGLFKITTDRNLNIQERGVQSPGFYSTDFNLDFPYGNSDLIQIIHSTLSTNSYHYFFDWKIRPVNLECEGLRHQVWARVDTTTSIDNIGSFRNEFQVWPNPVDDIIYLDLGKVKFVTIYNVQTGYRETRKLMDNKIDLTGFPSGLYFLEVSNDRIVRRARFIKI